MNPIKRSLRAFALLAGSYVILTLVYVLPVDRIFMLRRTPSIFYLIPAVLCFMYFVTRIIDRRVRMYLAAVGAMIIFWSILRAAKYIAFEESEGIARFIWYLFYIPMLTIPQFSFQAALSVGRPEEKKLPLLQVITGIFTVLCILIVLTNDLHQMVFRFQPEFANWDLDYRHEPLFWIITIWAWLFFFFSTSVLFHKCRLSASRKLVWIPVAYLGIGVFGLYLLNIGMLPTMWGANIGEFQDMACYTLGGFWILCITIGLVPSNKGYGKLLQETSLAARIADLDYAVAYQSRSALPLTKEQLASPGPIRIDENTLVHRSPVTGGFAYWQVDIAELNQINRELEETREQIAEEAELIRQANELKERRAQIDAKSKVYDEIAVRVLPQSQKIAQLSAEVRDHKRPFAHHMRLASVYAAYIKRMSNMMLLASEGRMKQQELALALSESVRYLNKAGILAEVNGRLDEAATAPEALPALYEHFEILLEQALPALKALHITLTGNTVKLTFEGAALTLPEDWDGTAETDDDTTFVRLYLREDGDGS